jgi:NAD(P)-dependent dehydrogenase (short-subunit alcohol dehydrogenase family)
MTGAVGSIGRALALALAAAGVRVVVDDLGGAGSGDDEGRAHAVAAEICAAGGHAVATLTTSPTGGVLNSSSRRPSLTLAAWAS